MKVAILVAVFLEVGLFYWGEYIVKDPLKEDLHSLCLYKKNQLSKSQLQDKLLHPDSIMLLHLFEENYSPSNQEILLDYARSKKRNLRCI